MPLPDDYLRYPLRRHGMDHDRYDWSILFRRPRVTWPDKARVALWIVPSLQWFPLNQTGKPFKAPGALERPYPDYRYYTHRDYGNRVGIFRIFKILDRLGLKASVAMNAAVARRYPFLVEQVNRRGYEIIAHGVDMDQLHYGGLDPEQEAGQVKEAVTTLREVSGQPVTGWLSPGKSESDNTLDLIAAEGIDYVCDWANDDLPYPLRTAHGEIHAMPHSHEIDDRLILLQYHHSENAYAQQLIDQFDTLYAESERYGGRIMAITLHPWVVGHPYRVKPLERALAHIAGHDGVWSATGAEILAAFRNSAG
jgi:peptidoglycan/xylan/chitin deacetylase (PgdA/CDA1 family)